MVFLIVDEDTMSAKLLKNCINQYAEEITVIIYSSAKDALEYAVEHSVDGVFTEVVMHGMDGYTLTKKLKEIDKRIFVSFVTDSKEYALNAFRVFANDYIVKPVTRERIADSIKQQNRFAAS